MAWTQTDLDNVEAAIRARLTGGAVSRYSIEGRSLEYIPLKELYELRNRILREINASTTARTKAGLRYS